MNQTTNINWENGLFGRIPVRDVLKGLLLSMLNRHKHITTWTDDDYQFLDGMTDRIIKNDTMHCIDYPHSVKLELVRDETGRVSGTIGGEPLDHKMSLNFANHSPDGFNWGYSGSGPAQLALACCLVLFPYPLALRLYQRFKFDIIAGIQSEEEFVTVEVPLHGFLSKNIDIVSEYQTQLVREGLLG